MITMTDLFCGAGGSSSGAVTVPGVQVVHAANHWQLAVEVHNSNHPDTDHSCADLHQEDPRHFPATDLLWASPECTKWSQANSNPLPAIDEGLFEDPLSDDAAVRSRLLMFDVLRFAEHHRYRAMIIENVVDIATQPRYATAWAEWRRQLRGIGYDYRVVSLNSMHAQAHGDPAPQSRDRLYVVAWRQGVPAPDVDSVMRPRAWCPRCESVIESRQAFKPGRSVGRYRAQYVYVCGACGSQVEPGWLPAAAAIDWTLPGHRIGDRAKPLAAKTVTRIAAGIARYWAPFTMEAAGHTYDAADPKHRSHGDPNGYYRTWATSDVLRTLHTIGSKALAVPVEGRDGKTARPISEALRTQTCRNETGLAFLAELRGGGSDARPVSEPLSTVTAGGNHHALIMRNNSSKGDGAEMLTPAHEVLRTLTTAGHQSLVTPGDLEAARAQVDDCMFRMLEPHEIAAGMAFPRDYRWLGSKRERVRMAGAAVTPPSSRDLVACVVDALAGAA